MNATNINSIGDMENFLQANNKIDICIETKKDKYNYINKILLKFRYQKERKKNKTIIKKYLKKQKKAPDPFSFLTSFLFLVDVFLQKLHLHLCVFALVKPYLIINFTHQTSFFYIIMSSYFIIVLKNSKKSSKYWTFLVLSPTRNVT